MSDRSPILMHNMLASSVIDFGLRRQLQTGVNADAEIWIADLTGHGLIG